MNEEEFNNKIEELNSKPYFEMPEDKKMQKLREKKEKLEDGI